MKPDRMPLELKFASAVLILATSLYWGATAIGGGTDNPVPVQGGGHAPTIAEPERTLDTSAPAPGGKGKKNGNVATDNGAKGGDIVTAWSNQMGHHRLVTKRTPSDKPGEAAKRHGAELRKMIDLVGGHDGSGPPTGGGS